MYPWDSEFHGRFERSVVESSSLRDNPLGDPAERPIWVYLPPGVEHAGGRFPAIYVLQGFAHNVEDWWTRSAFRPTMPEMIDELFADSGTPPTIVVFVDAWTAVGGSQFINSPATGRYLDYLCDDLVPWVDGLYPTIAEASARAVTGHSSGGYGALVAPMLRPDVFGALASHSADSLFEYCYLPDISAAARALRYGYEGSYDAFWQDFRSRPAFTKGPDFQLVNVYAMAACYSPTAEGGVELPFDVDICALRDDVWARWLRHDPVRMVPRHAQALRGLRAIYLDAGRRDDAYLDLGAIAVSSGLAGLGIDHHFELFDAGHSRIEYRYPLACRYLAERLAR